MNYWKVCQLDQNENIQVTLFLSCLILSNFNNIRCLFLLLVDKVCVDLGCTDVFVGEHFAYGVDVCATGYEQGSVGVAEAMEGDVFFNSG